MVSDLPPETQARAAALVCAVADHDAEAVREAIGGLEWTALAQVAVAIAAMCPDDTAMRLKPVLPGIVDVLREVSVRWRVSMADILSTSRAAPVCEARAVTCYIAIRGLRLTTVETGKRLGRDHSTVCYSVARVGENARLRAKAEALMADLGLTSRQFESVAS